MSTTQTKSETTWSDLLNVLPYVGVVVLSGLVGYFGARTLSKSPTPKTSASVEQTIKKTSLEDRVYLRLFGANFDITEGRVGKNLDDLERELREKSEKVYEVKIKQVNDKYSINTKDYNNMTEAAKEEAMKSWGLNVVKKPVEKPVENNEKTSYHQNIRKLNSDYDAILNFGKGKK